jgi:hypothetical protein
MTENNAAQAAEQEIHFITEQSRAHKNAGRRPGEL